MPSTNNNTNWNKKSDNVYESTLPLNKYDDPDNSIDKKKGTVIVRTDIKTGEVQYLEKTTVSGAFGSKSTTETLMRTVKADGSETHNSPTLNAKYFGAGNPDGAQGQEERITKQTRYDVLSLAKQVLPDDEYQALRQTEEYKSTANNPNTDPDKVTVSADGDFNVANVKGRAIPEGKDLLRYPLDIPDLGYDFIRITAYEYTAGGRQALTLNSKQSAKQRLIKDSKKKETVILPMQPNFSESNAVSWGGDNINPLQMIAGRAAMTGIEALGNFGDLEGMGKAAKKGIADIGNDISAMLSDPASGPALVAYFAGQAVGANILGRTAGVTLNPNLELLFKGPNLRTFNFNFRFTPRSAKESEEIKQIIRVFKKNMAVQRSTSNLFLLTPRVFTVEYIYNANNENAGQLHPYLNVFKPMAMTNLNVNYTPDGTYMTYNETGSLTAYDLQMSFGELEPIYADEFEDSSDDAIGSFSQHRNMGY